MEKYFVPQWVSSIDRIERISRLYDTRSSEKFTPLLSIDGACLFYLNPFMFGVSLEDWLKQNTPSLSEARSIVLSLISALIALGDLSHGNLLAGNIFVPKYCKNSLTVCLGPMSDVSFPDNWDLILVNLILSNPTELVTPISEILHTVIETRQSNLPLSHIIAVHWPSQNMEPETFESSYENTYALIKSAVEKREMTIYPLKPAAQKDLIKSAIQYLFAKLIYSLCSRDTVSMAKLTI